ncbi:PAS domain-containing protein [Candidatus Binatia bacterium]|jgi:PAS domain S-box-containing protein|nr:PAS domain-containing protein [Candidatus Binatia bacterium]
MQRQHLRAISRAPGSGLLHRLPDAVVTFDREWRYVFMNRQAEINHRCRPGELLGRCVWDVFPEGRELETYRRFMRALDTQQEDVFDEYLPMFGRWYEQRLFPSPHGLTVVARDITDWLELREEHAQLASRLAALEAAAPASAVHETTRHAIVREPAVQPDEDDERPLRIIVTMFPKPGKRDEMIGRFRNGQALLDALQESGALSTELQVADDPNGPLVVTILWDSAAKYALWTSHPQRRSSLEEVAPLAEEVCIERYEVVRLVTTDRGR